MRCSGALSTCLKNNTLVKESHGVTNVMAWKYSTISRKLCTKYRLKMSRNREAKIKTEAQYANILTAFGSEKMIEQFIRKVSK